MHRIRAACVALLGYLLAAPLAHAVETDGAVVFMYHRFADDRFPSTNVRREQFAAQLALLKAQDFNVISLEELLQHLTDEQPLPDNAVVLTIDDAFRSVYDVAHPMLKSYGFPYTVFVSSDGIDDGITDYMTWEQMRELAADGVTFANHGASHRSLIDPPEPNRYDAWLAADIARGMRRLREELEPIEGVFAYPYGEFNERATAALRDAGYRFAFGQHSGPVGPLSPALELPRFPINETYGPIEDFRLRARSLPLPVATVSPPDHHTGNRLPRITIELAETLEPLDRGLACYVSGQGRVETDWSGSSQRFRTGPRTPLGAGRNRINCTAPAGDGRYYWFSHPWFVRQR